MSPPARRPHRADRRPDERGIAMLAALMCVIVIVSLTVVAVQQSVGSLSGLAQSRKTLQTVDAAEAGLQYEINAVRAAAADLPGAQLNCPVGSIPVTLSQSSAGQPNVANAASSGFYTLSVTTASTPPSSAGVCTGSGLTVPSGDPWYALIKARGTTSGIAGGVATGRTLEALVKVDANPVAVSTTTTTSATTTTLPTVTTLVPTYGAMGNFTEALFGLNSIAPGGSFALTDPGGNANAFTGGPLTCGNSNTFQGILQAYLTTGSGNEASGACQVTGSLFVNGPVSLSNGAALYQNVYSTGAAILDGGFTVSGSVYADGNVTVSNGTKVHGTVYANGTVTLSGGSSVGGNIYATGGVFSSGSATVSGTIEAQTGNISYAGTASSGPAFVSAGHTVTPCPKSSAGPASCAFSLPGDFPAITIFPTSASLPPAPPFPTLNYSASAWQQGGYTTVTNNNCVADSGKHASALDPTGVYAAIVAAEDGSTPTVVRTTCQITWGDDSLKRFTFSLHSNLAIIADGGINFSTAVSSVGSADGSPHNFYLVVPTQTDGGTSNAITGGTSCPGSGTDFTPADNIGNIDLATNLNSPATVHDFLYTPNSVCTHGSTNLDGKVYAGGQFSAGGGYTQQFYDIEPYGQNGTTGVPVTTTTLPVTNYSATAAAQAANLALLNGSATVAASATPTQATYAGTGSGSNVTASNQPGSSLLAGDSWLTAALLSEKAEADTNGSSDACAAVLSVGDAINALPSGCSVTGSGTGGFGLDISKLPGLGSLLSVLADVKLVADTATAFASEGAGAVPNGSASLLNAKVVVTSLLGIQLASVNLTIPTTPNSNLLSVITSALGTSNNPVVKNLVSTLSSTAITGLLNLETNYQTPANPGAGVLFGVSALHLSLLGTSAVADLAHVTVGPDSATAAPTTTTTTPTTLPGTTTTTIPAGVTVVWIKQV